MKDVISCIADAIQKWKPYRLSVKAKTTEECVLRFTGPHVRAYFLKAISRHNPDLAERLHAPSAPAPYAITPIAKIEYHEGRRILIFSEELHLKKNDSVLFSIKFLSETLYEEINPGVLLSVLNTKAKIANIELNVNTFYVERLEIKINEIPRRFAVYFETPTFFRRKGSNYRVVFPDPPVIFASIARMFGKLMDIKLDIDAIKEVTSKNVGALSYNLHTTRAVDIGRGRKVVGFVGKCIYECADNETAKLVYMLLKIGEIMNVGGSRSLGFGVIRCKPIPNKHPTHI